MAKVSQREYRAESRGERREDQHAAGGIRTPPPPLGLYVQPMRVPVQSLWGLESIIAAIMFSCVRIDLEC